MTKKTGEESQEEETICIIEDEPIASAQKKAEEYKDIAQRVQAEFDNFRRRNNDSVRIARNEGINDFIIDLLPVLDNYERAICAICDDGAKQGVELIYKQLVKLLNQYGAEEIEALGQPFDPLFHHAIARCEESGEEAGTVTEVFQKGYKRKDKVLRPSMVKVAQ